eukprot:3108884-Amphidinium_carterae.1
MKLLLTVKWPLLRHMPPLKIIAADKWGGREAPLIFAPPARLAPRLLPCIPFLGLRKRLTAASSIQTYMNSIGIT